jgi:uncharacterized protein
MTPQELKLLDELFDRLASLESAPRDPDAVRAINEGLKLAPNALYPLVQTALVQDEALKQADARIRELEAELGIGQPQQPQQGGFLDNMRDTLTGRREPDQRGSVPSVRPGAASGAPQSPWRNTTGMQGDGYRQEPGYAAAPQQAPSMSQGGMPGAGGGSFLGTAAATAAGVVGGALLMNSFRGMFGGGGQSGGAQGQSHSALDSSGGGGGSPWGGNVSGSGIARDAGVNDIAGGGRMASNDGGGSDRAGLLDTAQNETGEASDFDDSDTDDGGDFGDDGGDN